MEYISRRNFIKLGVLGAPIVLTATKAGAQTTTFNLPLRVPPTLIPSASDATTDYYDLRLRQEAVHIVGGTQTLIWGFNGSYPGPTIRATRDRRVIVRHTNDLPEAVSIHLHGGHIPADSDGHPTSLISPGAYRDYVYPNRQLPATLWYHDHTMDRTGRNVYRGLAGFYLLTDEIEDSMMLPRGRYEIPLVIQDRTFNADGSLAYSNTGMNRMNGFLGDRVVVNGQIQPFHFVERRKYRLRILNGSNARTYQLAFSNDLPFYQIGSDGGMLSSTVVRSSITLAPAERVDVVVDFSAANPGSNIQLLNQIGTGTTAEVMQFRVIAMKYGKDTSVIPTVLRPVDRIPPASASVTRNFTLNLTMAGGMTFTFNNQAFDPNRIDATPSLGATEIWSFNNQTNMLHPIHIHGIQWQILDVNGAAPPPWELGWKDTFVVPANGTTRVIGKFTDYAGDYVFHCHILEHEDFSMMGQFRVI